jgi:hypothetical protein
MKELRGTAAALVPAPLEDCLALVQAVEAYPEWHPDVVRSVEVVDGDAGAVPRRVRTQLHLSVGPLTKDFELLMAVTVRAPTTVKLAKVGGNAKFDVTWHLQDGANTRLALELEANLDAPRFLPLGGIGDSVAQGFVSAASTELVRRSRGG